MAKGKQSTIQEEIEKIVDAAIEKHESKLKKEDAIEIVNAILPEIEKIVSKLVIKHFKALSIYVQKNLKG